MLVMKFGGSSVSNAENLVKVSEIIKRSAEKEEKLLVVCSAMHGITDLLIKVSRMAESGDISYSELYEQIKLKHLQAILVMFTQPAVQISVTTKIEEIIQELHSKLQGIFLLGELSDRSLDSVAGIGERISSTILYEYIHNSCPGSHLVDARKLIITDDVYGAAKANLTASYSRIKGWYDEQPGSGGIWITPGFIASNAAGIDTTLGRGGSDFTAAIFGAALNVSEIQIWTDVNGVLTADPRKVKKAFSISDLSYEEAMEMSHFGAKVLYPPTVMPAYRNKIPIRIKNTFDPEFEGTLISAGVFNNKFMVKGVTSVEHISLLTLKGSGMASVSGISARLFGTLSAQRIQVILIMQGSSEYSITFAIHGDLSLRACKLIEEEFGLEILSGLLDKVAIEKNLCLLAVVGENMKHVPGIAGRFLTSLGRNGINVTAIAQGSSELTIAVAISQDDLSKALNSSHETFFLSDTKTLNLFIIGVGNIGGSLLDIMEQQRQFLKFTKSVELNLVGLANSKKMLFSEDGIDMTTGKQELSENGQPMLLSNYIDQMIQFNLPNSIFIDCTADAVIPDAYAGVLDASISIVTPNKVANSGSYDRYKLLKKIQQQRGVKYLYETNVGAGLPVIGTLNDLLNSGDKILKIEAVLSGSLSFVFNSLAPHKKFSDIVKSAMQKGFTEPDPRVDLSGADFARKLVILARECNIALEIEDVEVDPILQAHYFNSGDVSEFLQKLPSEDERFTELASNALKSGKLRRFIGVIEDGKAAIKLLDVDNTNPFYNLSGSDNLISFTTNRYKERPLVVKGPGAGAEVTAAGVFSEIITISSSGQSW